MTSSLRLLITTFADKKTATSIVRMLVEEKLIACGTLLPEAHSIYYWQETLEEANEVVVLIKTSQVLLASCQERLAAIHPYEVPEMIVLEPSSVNHAYQAWLENILMKIHSDDVG